MIHSAFLHFHGIGPKAWERLKAQGIHTWEQALAAGSDLPVATKKRSRLLEELALCQDALQRQDLAFLCRTLKPADHWRIAEVNARRLTWFDIETDGTEASSQITVIAALHRGQVHSFVRGENLDDFLDLLNDVELLGSFNGNSFDVPRVLSGFHIPTMPCPHLDLRWICWHAGWRGGLKHIEREMGLARDSAIASVDGLEAIALWLRWKRYGDTAARNSLVQYCCADVQGLPWVLDHVVAHAANPMPIASSNPLPASTAPAPASTAPAPAGSTPISIATPKAGATSAAALRAVPVSAAENLRRENQRRALRALHRALGTTG